LENSPSPRETAPFRSFPPLWPVEQNQKKKKNKKILTFLKQQPRQPLSHRTTTTLL
jgi:hypothetical protein